MYNFGISVASMAEAAQVYQMFTKHRNDSDPKKNILDYEKTYSSQIAAANGFLALAGTIIVTCVHGLPWTSGTWAAGDQS